jgi:hypothetical protein
MRTDFTDFHKNQSIFIDIVMSWYDLNLGLNSSIY